MGRKILINISVASGMMTPPFCHREAILQGQSGTKATVYTNDLAPDIKHGMKRVRIIKRHVAQQGLVYIWQCKDMFQQKSHRVRVFLLFEMKIFLLWLQLRIALSTNLSTIFLLII